MKGTKAGSAMRCDADRLPGRKRVTFDIEEPRIVAIESFKHQALWMSPYSNLVKHGIPCRVSVTHDTGDVAAPNSAHRVAIRKAALDMFAKWLKDPNGGENVLDPTDYEAEQERQRQEKGLPFDPTDYGSLPNFRTYLETLQGE